MERKVQQGFGPMLKDYLDYYKINQTDFALRLGISKKHLNEILNDKSYISLELMIAISLITDIDVNLIFFCENSKKLDIYLHERFKGDKEIKKYLDSFYINDLYKNKWIVLRDKTSYLQNAYDLLQFLHVDSFDKVLPYINSKVLFKKREDADNLKTYLWIRRCENILEQNMEIGEYNSSKIGDLLQELKRIRVQKFDEDLLKNLFRKYGIYLIIEDTLPGTKIRGCSMVKKNNPCIFISRMFKEKSSLYFTLYHELGHIKTDFNKLKNKIVVNDRENEDSQDKFALGCMISESDFQKMQTMSEDEIVNFCSENYIPLTFYYTRLAFLGIISYKDKKYLNSREKIDV